MSDISGIPNLGIPGLSGFNGGGGVNGIPGASGLADAQTQYELNRRFFGNQANTLAQADVPQAQLYGGGGFGAQTAYHAGLGAAYGRGTGGFNAIGGVTQPVGSRGRGGGSSVFNTGTTGVPYLEGGGMPYGGGGFGRGSSIFDTGTSGIPYLGGGGMPFGGGGFGRGRDAIAQAMMPPAPNFNDTFSQVGMRSTPTQMQNQPAIDQMLRFNGVGTGVSADAPATPPSPGADFNERFNIETSGVAGSPGSFADRFAGGNYFQPGQPSEYTTSPYEDTSGRVHQPSQLPPGFSSPYSFDNPGGALGRGGFQGSQAPIMNSSEGADTLTAQDTDIPHRGFTAGTGSFDPSAFNPSQFAPGSPFGSGRGARAGVGTINPSTSLPFFGGEGSGFGAPGSTQNGGLYAGRGRFPALIGAGQDTYGNPFIQGNAQPFAQSAGRMGGGIGLGGLDALGQGTIFRGR